MSTTKEALRLSADSNAEVVKPRAPARNSGRAKLRNGRKSPSRSASPLKLAASREQKQPDARARQLHAAMMAFRDGDFAVRLPTDWEGIEGRIAEAFNQALAHEDRITREITRLSTAVGKEGRLRQRMSVPGAIGGWAEKVELLNSLLDDLVRPTTDVARTIGAVAKGDLGQSMELEVDGRPLKGEFLRSAKLVNTMIEQLSVFTSEVTRVAREVGTEGKLGGQAQVKGVSGVWKELTESVNQMAGNLTAQVRNIADVTIAVANGDLSKKITVDVRGEILQLKEAINKMVDQLRSFGSEVTRVAREVGTDGRLGGQAVVPGVAGTWKDLTDSVNAMATNLTAQVRNIAQVTTAVARGDLSRKITVDVKGEILELKETINTMVDQLNGFSSEVTRVAREVGTEGKLGGQAQVGGVAGTWKDLTDSVNSMASNLTGQVRNIAEVTTAVAKGDLRPMLGRADQITVSSLAATSLRVDVDRTRLEQSLVNLLLNAIKFTSGNRLITVTVERQHADAVISIADNGIGIEPDMLSRIFDLFSQADQSLDRSQGGLGIGLFICKRLIELHGGTITAFSEGAGRGAAFEIRLPVLHDSTWEAPAMKTTETAVRPREGTAKRILIVDDNVDAAMTLSWLLAEHGYTVEIAHDGAGGLQAAQAFKPEILLLDIGLPGIDGFELARRLRSDGFSSAKLIAISGYAHEADMERSRAAGFDRHFAKPVDFDVLVRFLAQS